MTAIGELSSAQDDKDRDLRNFVAKLAERVDAQAVAMSSPPNPPPDTPHPVTERPVNSGKGSKYPWLDPFCDPWHNDKPVPTAATGKGVNNHRQPNPKSGAGSLPGKPPGEAPSHSHSPAPSEAASSVNRCPLRSSPEPSDAGSSGGGSNRGNGGGGRTPRGPNGPGGGPPNPGGGR